MSGFETLRQIAEHNAEALKEALEEEPEERREGVPVDLWRALKPSGPDGS